MRQMLKLWNDDCGALIATEWVFVVTILILGIITGLVAVRQAVISELTETAQAILALWGGLTRPDVSPPHVVASRTSPTHVGAEPTFSRRGPG